MKITKLDHVAIAVRSLESALAVYENALGLECAGREHVPGEAVNVAFLPLGGTRIELLEPSDPGSALARSIEARGEGLHHLCFVVEDLHSALEELRACGFRVLDEREGAGGTRVAFVHPKSTGGVLIELRQTS